MCRLGIHKGFTRKFGGNMSLFADNFAVRFMRGIGIALVAIIQLSIAFWISVIADFVGSANLPVSHWKARQWIRFSILTVAIISALAVVQYYWAWSLATFAGIFFVVPILHALLNIAADMAEP
jgi:hypothetical protein